LPIMRKPPESTAGSMQLKAVKKLAVILSNFDDA